MERDFNWALVGTGGIVRQFMAGLREIGAPVSAVVSRTEERAREFATQNGIDKAFGNLDRMLDDREIDIVYIGTPHTTHKELTVQALRAGKAVLCEKPFAVNANEAREMIRVARENGVFLMEAMWTRFLPAIVKVREWLSLGLAGDVKTLQANFGFRANLDPKGRLFNPELAGGALLDVGVYPLSFASMVFGGRKPDATDSRLFIGETGVDEEAAAILSYGGPRTAFASASLRTAMTNDAWIYGTGGKIHVPEFFMASGAVLYPEKGESQAFNQEGSPIGLGFEAREMMNLLAQGLTESPMMPLDESLLVMETMDSIRARGNLRYPGEESR